MYWKYFKLATPTHIETLCPFEIHSRAAAPLNRGPTVSLNHKPHTADDDDNNDDGVWRCAR